MKVSVVDKETGLIIGSDFYPKEEAPIKASRPGWAEQNPEDWWSYLKIAMRGALEKANVSGKDVKAIGISYQMHGLVIVDKKLQVLRPSLIWCDSRAVTYGDLAFKNIGEKFCLSHLLNSPGNFTASKLAWVKEYEPEIFKSIYKIMLPGDYIAMRLTGSPVTTVSGLSEGVFWDFQENKVSDELMSYYGFDNSLIPEIRPTFGLQGEVMASVASELGLKKGTPVTYRAGDQPNNALSLNVLNPGEIASTGGTSGVVYGVNDKVNYDPYSRVNTFAHVNHDVKDPRLGVLLCINGVGILNSWIKRNVASECTSYPALNELAATVPIQNAKGTASGASAEATAITMAMIAVADSQLRRMRLSDRSDASRAPISVNAASRAIEQSAASITMRSGRPTTPRTSATMHDEHVATMNGGSVSSTKSAGVVMGRWSRMKRFRSSAIKTRASVRGASPLLMTSRIQLATPSTRAPVVPPSMPSAALVSASAPVATRAGSVS